MDTIEAVGKHDFNASSPDELSFRKGDHLQVRRVLYIYI